jgi:transposase
MYIHTIPNRNSPPAILLRESYREDGKIKNRTIANISHWPKDKIEAMRRVLSGDKLIGVDEMFETVRSYQHGHVQAVLLAMEKLGFKKLIDNKSSKERDLIIAMVVSRIINPTSKLATQRGWHDTTLPQLLDIETADEDDLYEAMDWLLTRQEKIEERLASRHLSEGGLVLYDLTSSYVEGSKCPLAEYGYNRDQKRNKLQINYGLLTDGRGCPVSVSVYKGNTGDSKTLLPAVEKVRNRFGLHELVLVGDRGMISQKQIDVLKEMEGVDWITALKTGAIRELAADGSLQLGLFDERNLFSIQHPDYPGERLTACLNPALRELRGRKRESLIEATKKELDKVQMMVKTGKLKKAAAIGVRVGKIVNKYKMAKHFILEIEDGNFTYQENKESIATEAALDGIYVVRTSLLESKMSSEDTVRNYKALSQVERAFRSLKTIDLKVRPIFHYAENRVKAHIFLCMLAHYVEWHMQEALRPLLFSDEEQEAKKERDPVAPAKRSSQAEIKALSKKIDDGTETHSFRTLLNHFATIVRNCCKRKNDTTDDKSEVIVDSTPNLKQQRAFELLKQIVP